MAKFGVNVVVLVDNMLLVFFYFSPKLFKKKFLHSLYYEKKIRTKLPTKKKNSCRENFSTPLPGYLMVHPLGNIIQSHLGHNVYIFDHCKKYFYLLVSTRSLCAEIVSFVTACRWFTFCTCER